MRNFIKCALSAAIIGLALPSIAATTWSLTPSDGCADGSSSTNINQAICSAFAGTPVASIQALSTSNGTATVNQTASTVINTYANDNTNSVVNWYSTSWGAGPHSVSSLGAVDNDGKYGMLLLTFSKAVNLTAINIGFNGSDNTSTYGSDISVLAYKGTNAVGFTNRTWGGLVNGSAADGWAAIGNYVNVGTSNNTLPNTPDGTANIATQSAGIFSTAWLIGAYNPLAIPGSTSTYCANDTTSTNCSVTTTPADLFKLASVAGNVPEPGSLALLGAAALGLLSVRRRKQA